LEFVGSIMDVTKSKKTEESLQQAQAQLAHVARVTVMGELAASIAHEVNQPLTAVITSGNACIRWLGAQEPNVEEAMCAAALVIQEANRAAQIIARIRAFMKKAPPKVTPLDLNELITGVLALASHEIQRAGVLLRTELAGDLRPGMGDAVQLQQVVINLIMNAVEAMASSSGHALELLVTSQNMNSDEIVVSVSDAGAGISPDRLAEIFNPFFTSKPEGMGMGLSISRSIIEAHGGRLWAERNDDRGTTFRFSLPIPRPDS
jgi:C4-dicarboxylate-specific signal transduction histidine kinase